MIIDFLSVFEAKRGLALLRIFSPDKDWGIRDHDHGKLQYLVSDIERSMLIANHVGFIDIKISPSI
jgi:hypothetical protein